VAQLGARFHGMEEVIGSIPIRSTKNPSKSAVPWTCLSGARQIGRELERHFEPAAEKFVSISSQ
jgi:hypothetical protein